MTSLVTATFKTRMAAEAALRSLETLGVTDDQISLIVTDETRGNSFNIETGSKIDEGAAAGATAGGIIGAVLGSLATATAIAIPGLNIVVAGTAVSALAGLGAGATAGGFIGALAGAGIPEHEAKIYENEIKNGSVLVAVKPENGEQKDQIKDIFERQDAHNLAA
jgi:predicted phage tail protein